MIALFFMIYAVLGAAAGWGLYTFAEVQLTLAICGGAIITALLGQVHLFSTRAGDSSELTTRLDALESAQHSEKQRIDVVEARTTAVETTVKQELTERRDALVSEMRQLETLIERLSRSFETKLADAETAGEVAPQEDAVLRRVKDALEDGRVDLHLQPIVSLPQRRVSFYEGFTRLRDADGSLILPADFLDAARRANLLGVVDNMMLYRSVEVVRRLAARDRRVGVFCNVSSHSLEDPHFFPFFLSHLEQNRDLAGALIFEIRSSRFEHRSRQMREAMERLTALGFRFSIDHAESIELDLPRLQDAGIRFVKIKGGTLIDQLRDPFGPRPNSAADRKLSGEEVAPVCSRYGVTLIAEKIEEEVSVVEVLEYGIPYGQGHIFGAPRPIKSSLMEETAPPAELVRMLTARAS
ncbi:MAG: EAL domain-containing protein [Pseudomonadota bacterium]|nr:EAL domain-containing protein [Pseudomonadota bacterium]